MVCLKYTRLNQLLHGCLFYAMLPREKATRRSLLEGGRVVGGETSGNSTRRYTVAPTRLRILRACDPGVAEGDFVPSAAGQRYTLPFPSRITPSRKLRTRSRPRRTLEGSRRCLAMSGQRLYCLNSILIAGSR